MDFHFKLLISMEYLFVCCSWQGASRAGFGFIYAFAKAEVVSFNCIGLDHFLFIVFFLFLCCCFGNMPFMDLDLK